MLVTVISALVVAGAIVVVGRQVANAITASRARVAEDRALRILEMFAPAVAAAARDPRAFVVWQPLADMARRMHPDAFAALDEAAGATFPFTKEQLRVAHAQWTTDWLSWERTHDTEYKMKAAAIEREISSSGVSAALRARLDAIEVEKLDSYQRRYEEYIRLTKALQALGG